MVTTTYLFGRHGRNGKPRPERIPNALLGMWLFVIAETMLFCGLISAYMVLRGHAGAWPPAGQPRLPVWSTAVNTGLLLASGWSMWHVVSVLRAGQRTAAARWLWVTFGLGASFLALQGLEWVRLISFGLTTTSSLYASLFYTLIGVHGLHVCGGLAALGIGLSGVQRGHFTPERPGGLLAVRLFWLFVVAVWPVLYVLVYLT